MRTMLAGLGVAAVIGLLSCQGAAAFPAGAAALGASAGAAPTLQLAQYSERHTRHGVVKCYREFVVGRYVCRRYHYW